MMTMIGSMIIDSSLFSDMIVKMEEFQRCSSVVQFKNGRQHHPHSDYRALACFVFIAVSGSLAGGTSLFGAIFGGIMPSSNVHSVNVVRYMIPIGNMGQAISPIGVSNLIIERHMGVPITTIIKYCLIPTLVYVLSSILVQTFFL